LFREKIDFGQEPTVRVNHLLFPNGAGTVKLVVATYARLCSCSMLFLTRRTRTPGFFLIGMNDSRTPDFGSLKLAIVRKVATGKAVEGTRDTLEIYQRRTTSK
jgi:hypothetical protein